MRYLGKLYDRRDASDNVAELRSFGRWVGLIVGRQENQLDRREEAIQQRQWRGDQRPPNCTAAPVARQNCRVTVSRLVPYFSISPMKTRKVPQKRESNTPHRSPKRTAVP
eukprot:SAG31_NODE_1432_length_8373_cov_8.838289_4_plen_110_part_00